MHNQVHRQPFAHLINAHRILHLKDQCLLNEQKVACVPGCAFGKEGEGFIRISYAYSIEQIREAIARIDVFLKNLKKVAENA